VLDARSAQSQQDDERFVAMASEVASLRGDNASLRGDNASLRGELEKAQDALANLRVRYHQLLEELHLLKRRLFVAKAERLDDIADAQLAFDKLLAETQAIKKVLDAAAPSDEPKEAASPAPSDKPRERTRNTAPTGRRDLSKCDLPEIRVELSDPQLEGKAERIGVEETSRVAFERGGYRRLIVARVVYKEPEPSPPPRTEGPTDGRIPAAPTEPSYRFITAPMPKEIMARGMLAPSMIAHVLAIKYVLGVPFYRYEQQCAHEGFALDRGTMCRYSEHVGATLGCIVEAARKEAIATAFCLSTDATGVAIQPIPLPDGTHQPCRKGHFFVTLADKDHVFFDFQPKHTSLAVWQMFKGFSG
jgi:transposase